MEYIFKIVRKISLSLGILYSYNILLNSFNIPIPINITNICITTILGIPGFLGLIIFYMINYM